MSFNALPDKFSDLVLQGYGFWPDLPLREFQSQYRLPGEYSADLMLNHLHLARIWAAKQLESWHKEQLQAGYDKLAAVPLHGDVGGALLLWKRAVYCHAKALLLPQFATLDRREAAKNEAKESPEIADTFFAAANDAISDIIGRTRILVGLV